jgi:hypothetical protein
MLSGISGLFKKKDGRSKIVRSVIKLHYRNIFGLTFLLGSASIVMGWVANSPYLLGVAFPVLILLVYSSLGLVEEKDETLIEQYADSIYFVGFLFTLVALIVSLLVLSEENYSLEGVGSRFGIALITTIIGLFLRIFLTNFRSSFSAKKTIVEEHLTKSIKEYSYQVESHARTLRSTTELYKTSMELSIASMQKSFEALTSGLESVSTQGVAQINKSFNSANDQLNLAAAKLFEKLELIQLPDDILVSPIQEPIKNLANLLNEYRDGFSAITQEQKKIAEDNRIFSNTLTALNETTKSLDDSIQKIVDNFSPAKELDINASDLNNSINRTATIIENMSTSLSQLGDIQPNIQIFINSITDINKATSGLSETINNHEKVISKIESISNSQLDMVKVHQREIEETMRKSSANLGLLNDGLKQSVQFITDELGRKSSGER